MIDLKKVLFIKRKVDAFAAEVVNHKHLDAVIRRVLFHLMQPAGIEIVVIVGPTGIGKSLAMGYISRQLEEALAQLDPDCADHRSVIHTVAMASGHRQFSFSSMYVSALQALGDPFLDRPQGVDAAYLRSLKLDTTAKLRIRLEEEMRFRRLLFWLLDEAQHTVCGGKSGSPGDQFDVLKSITQRNGNMFLLAGPCNMDLHLLSSSQLARRSVVVPFNRYRHDKPEELDEFANVANTLLGAMNLCARPNTNEVLTLLYDGAAGCVGILKDWLTRTYAYALDQAADPEAATLTAEMLVEMQMTQPAIEVVMKDIRRLDHDAKQRDGASYAEVVRGVAFTRGTDSALSAPSTSANNKRSLPVGKRKATRDPIFAPGMTS